MLVVMSPRFFTNRLLPRLLRCKGPVTPPPRNEKRETRKLSCNQKSAARRFYFSERENLDDFQDRQPTDFLPPRKILTNQREVQ